MTTQSSTTTVNFKDIPAALLSMFDIDALYTQRAPFYRWYIGMDVDAGMLERDQIVTQAAAAYFGDEALRLAQTEIDPVLLSSPAAKVAAVLGQLGMYKESVWFFDPSLKRAPGSFQMLVGVKMLFDYIRDSYGEREWFAPLFQRQLLARMIKMEPVNLALAIKELYFGEGSVGWMNADERLLAIKAIKEAIGADAQEGLYQLWKTAKGKKKDFIPMWKAYAGEMLNVLVSLAEKAHEKDVRLGKPAYDLILKGLRIGHTVEDIFAWANAQYFAIEDEMNRLADMAGFADWKAYWDNADPGEPLSDEALIEMYRAEADRLVKLFSSNGIIPPQPTDYTWKLMSTPAENRGSIPTAMYWNAPYFTENPGDMRTGTFYVTPAGNDKKRLLAHRAELSQTVAHELLGHGWCNAYETTTVPSSYKSIRPALLLPFEGVAVTGESAMMRIDGAAPSLMEAMAVLKSLAWRVARVIAEMSWHLGDKPLSQIIAVYAEQSGLSIDAATADISRATTEVWEFMVYAFGASGVEALGHYMGGTTLEAMRHLVEFSAGVVPQNLVAWAMGLVKEPEDFNWLVDFEIVGLTQKLFPAK